MPGTWPNTGTGRAARCRTGAGQRTGPDTGLRRDPYGRGARSADRRGPAVRPAAQGVAEGIAAGRGGGVDGARVAPGADNGRDEQDAEVAQDMWDRHGGAWR